MLGSDSGCVKDLSIHCVENRIAWGRGDSAMFETPSEKQ